METGLYDLGTIGGRLGYIAAKVGKRTILDTVDISESQLNNYIGNRVSKHTLEPLVEICIKHGYSVEWLAVGGEMEPTRSQDSPAPHYGHRISESFADYEPVRLSDEYMKKELSVDPAQCVFSTAKGDSMVSTINPGDILLVDKSESVDDGIYHFSIDSKEMVKRLQYLPGNQVKIISDNPKYESFVMNVDQLNILGCVVWHGGRV